MPAAPSPEGSRRYGRSSRIWSTKASSRRTRLQCSPRRRLPSRLPTVIPDDALVRLLAAPDVSTPIGLRDRAVLELLYATGARVSEVVGLRISDLDFGQGQVRLFGKGAKERLVPVYEVALSSVRTYLREGRPSLMAESCRGPRLPLLARSAALGRCRTAALQEIHCYGRCGQWDFSRTRCATRSPRISLKPERICRTVQELLGHVALSTTQIYTHLSMKRLQDVHSKAHPRA